MHSLYIHEMRKQKELQADKIHQSEAKIKQKRENSKKILSNKYKVRLTAQIENLPEHLLTKPEIRFPTTEKHFYTNYTSKQSRLQSAQASNKWLDTVPTPKSVYTLRKRNKSKELSSDFHYTSFSSMPKTHKKLGRRREKSLASGKTLQSFITIGLITHEIKP